MLVFVNIYLDKICFVRIYETFLFVVVVTA